MISHETWLNNVIVSDPKLFQIPICVASLHFVPMLPATQHKWKVPEISPETLVLSFANKSFPTIESWFMALLRLSALDDLLTGVGFLYSREQGTLNRLDGLVVSSLSPKSDLSCFKRCCKKLYLSGRRRLLSLLPNRSKITYNNLLLSLFLPLCASSLASCGSKINIFLADQE
ncbi:hypothetical protein DP116_19355 [Brasilonema bromeliae SPC951]|uniref:Uncharacterized protein n=1 Tax=Brasilonema bromeliae SPC951 TaxID=385972 RepID=A0ABX1PAN3_9CYAN|nr:hypothetical protein [Brasilonema bromeliae SPC951]